MELGFQGERFLYIPPECKPAGDNLTTSDLYLYAMGYFPHAAYHYIDRPEGCNEYLFIYCTQGKGWIELYGKRFPLTAEQFIILPRRTPHRYQADQQAPWTIYWLHFKGRKAVFLAKDFDKPCSISPNPYFAKEKRINLFEEIYSILDKGLTPPHIHYANLCLGHLLATFCFSDALAAPFQQKEYSENVMKRVIQYMNENIEGHITIKELTNFCGYSPSYFHRKFIKETGIPPMKYYMKLKIEKACQLLTSTNMKVNQIAYKLGFQDPQHFAHVFTSTMGVSAKEFHRLHSNLR